MCMSDPTLDATKDRNGVVTLKKSHATGSYGIITSRFAANGDPINIDDIVHDNVNATALVVLISGGDGDAQLANTTMPNTAPVTSSGNFLVRSAKLFAAQGYRVITVERPFDQETTAFAAQYDAYRWRTLLIYLQLLMQRTQIICLL